MAEGLPEEDNVIGDRRKTTETETRFAKLFPKRHGMGSGSGHYPTAYGVNNMGINRGSANGRGPTGGGQRHR